RLGREDVGRQDPPQSRLQRDDFRAADRGTSATEEREGLAGRQDGEELAHTRLAGLTERSPIPFPPPRRSRSPPRSTPILTLPNPSQSFDEHLSSLGLDGVGTVYRNQSVARLYEHALA